MRMRGVPLVAHFPSPAMGGESVDRRKPTAVLDGASMDRTDNPSIWGRSVTGLLMGPAGMGWRSVLHKACQQSVLHLPRGVAIFHSWKVASVVTDTAVN